MKKPVIRIYKYEGNYSYKCDIADEIYKKRLNNIKAIFYVLNIFYILEKDENGRYKNRPNLKPEFE